MGVGDVEVAVGLEVGAGAVGHVEDFVPDVCEAFFAHREIGAVVFVFFDAHFTGGYPETGEDLFCVGGVAVVVVFVHYGVAVGVLRRGFHHGEHLVEGPFAVTDEGVDVAYIIVVRELFVEREGVGEVVCAGQHVAYGYVLLVAEGQRIVE